MSNMNRRDFLRGSAGLVAASMVAVAPAQEASLTATTLRRLGNTGLSTTLLGMGTGTKANNKNSAQIRKGRETFLNTLVRGYELGVRYFDLSDSYGSHEYMREAMRRGGMDRSNLLLLTKSGVETKEEMSANLERFRKELDVDQIDIVLMHCLMDPEAMDKRKGAMEALSEAKQRGIIKAHGVSCHNLGAMKAASESPWVDVMLSRINPYQKHMDGSAEEVVEVLKRAKANGKGMLGMKILGEGLCADRFVESVRFALGTGCIDAFTIGFVEAAEVDDGVAKIAEAARA
jgi:aryl-alcohol dehydrogenase-like predicted oxidoreductase